MGNIQKHSDRFYQVCSLERGKSLCEKGSYQHAVFCFSLYTDSPNFSVITKREAHKLHRKFLHKYGDRTHHEICAAYSAVELFNMLGEYPSVKNVQNILTISQQVCDILISKLESGMLSIDKVNERILSKKPVNV